MASFERIFGKLIEKELSENKECDDYIKIMLEKEQLNPYDFERIYYIRSSYAHVFRAITAIFNKQALQIKELQDKINLNN